MGSFGMTMADIADGIARVVAQQAQDGGFDTDDGAVAYRLGRAHARIEAALSTPGIFGRVAIAQTMRDVCR